VLVSSCVALLRVKRCGERLKRSSEGFSIFDPQGGAGDGYVYITKKTEKEPERAGFLVTEIVSRRKELKKNKKRYVCTGLSVAPPPLSLTFPMNRRSLEYFYEGRRNP